jgi:AraC-like DNA-binding protein
MANNPSFLSVHPKEGKDLDPLTDVFTALHVKSVVHKRLEVTAPWGLSIGSYLHAKFGMIISGMCWITVQGDSPSTLLTEGDCYIVSHGKPFILQDSLETPARDFIEVVREQEGPIISYGGGGVHTSIIGGQFLFDGPSSQPLTNVLPSFLHLRANQTRALALQTTLQLLVSETASQDLGSQLVVNRLADILFVQAIRAYIASEERLKHGWLAALADSSIGAILRTMHQNMEYPWTVEALATTIGLSRSAFALRFKQLVGEGPMEYITRWRMYKASDLLRESEKNQMSIANMVGYDSDSAFNKAFKRIIGITPGEYRRKSAPLNG